MEKYKKYIGFIPAVALLLFAGSAFAATVTPSPSTVYTGSEGTISVTVAGTISGSFVAYLFDASGNNVSGNAAGLFAQGTYNWVTDLALPTGLTPETYTLFIRDASGDYYDGQCGAGTMLSACEAATSPYYATASVVVQANPTPPVIGSFTATPSSITVGSSSVLAWSVTGATSLTINGSTVTGSSETVTPSVTTVYTLAAHNSNGTSTASVTVFVNIVPIVGTADIGNVGGTMLTAVVNGSEYTLKTFGPPLFWFLLILALFFAIYYGYKWWRVDRL